MKRRRLFFTASPGDMRNGLWTEEAIQLANALGYDVTSNPHTHRPDEAGWAEMLRGVEALITTWGAPRLTAAVLAHADSLRIVGHAAGSVGPIVSPDLYARGIRITSANPVMAHGVAEWSLMMTLVGWRRLPEYARLAAGNAMAWGKRECVRGLRNATIAIWGYGDIARRLVRMLRPLATARILVHDDYLTDAMAEADGVQKVAFDDLFREGDVIHLLAALTEKSIDRVGAAQLAAIKDNAVLINTGRADLVQEVPLLEELRKNRFTAIFDVHYHEPLPPDDPFCVLPNVVLTPHCAGGGQTGFYVPFVLREFERFFAGQPLEGEVTAARAANMTQETLVRHGQQRK
jgi:phosphoglycerate dehydrogenase-like enzyme